MLRALGVAVDGGLQPTEAQVAKGYKKAMLQFHPDRNQASCRTLRQLVEAEETFKVISRMRQGHQ